MIQRKAFQITLPSNVMSSTENTLSDYITHLPVTYILPGDWEVGMKELHCTNSWYNIQKSTVIGIEDTRNRFAYTSTKLTPGRYSVTQLVRRINAIMSIFEARSDPEKLVKEFESLVTKAPQLNVDMLSNKIYVEPGITATGFPLLPKLEDSLLDMLGMMNRKGKYWYYEDVAIPDNMIETMWNDAKRDSIKGMFYSERAFDIQKGIRSIYVYSDIVEENAIGDSRVKCLGICTLSNTPFTEALNFRFDPPDFHPVSHNIFNTIRITLKDKTDENIKFNFGDTHVTLQFRPVSKENKK